MPALLVALADDIEWVAPGPSDVPTAGTYRGKQAVQDWFGTLSENLELSVFEPREFIAQGDKVISLLYVEAARRHNGRKVVTHEAHAFTIRDGKVARFQIYQDTAAVAAAYRGE